jgi:hypothetical protein
LEGVLDVNLMPQLAPADAEDEWAVALQQGGECGLIAVRDEACENLLVREQRDPLHGCNAAEVAEQRCLRMPAHGDLPLFNG